MKRTMQWHLDQADKIALAKVENMARKILKDHPQLNEFIMAMGTYFFTTKGDKRVIISATRQQMNANYELYEVDSFAYLKPLNRFLDKWDSQLKLTGEPMRFTATGKKVTDW